MENVSLVIRNEDAHLQALFKPINIESLSFNSELLKKFGIEGKMMAQLRKENQIATESRIVKLEEVS